MRVALDVTHARLNRTGLGRYPRELASRLEASADVELIALSAAMEPAARRIDRLAQGVAREATYYPGLLARKARRAGAEVLHCPTPAPVRGDGLPLVVTVHDLIPLRMPRLFTAETNVHTRLSLPFLRRAERIVTNSDWTRGEVTDLLGVQPERVVTTPFGVDSRFAPRPQAAERVRERLSLRGPYVLSVGTREPRKNIVGVLLALERLSEVELVLVGGKGWGAGELDAALQTARDRVHVTGFVSDEELVDLYSGAACFAYPSLAEGFGMPVLEAMACGAPVVTSDCTALAEVAADAALLVPPNDVDALAAALGRVLGDAGLAADLRERGLVRAATFTWERCARETVAAYRELLA